MKAGKIAREVREWILAERPRGLRPSRCRGEGRGGDSPEGRSAGIPDGDRGQRGHRPLRAAGGRGQGHPGERRGEDRLRGPHRRIHRRHLDDDNGEPEYQSLLEATEKALQAAIDVVKRDRRIGEIGKAISATAESGGLQADKQPERPHGRAVPVHAGKSIPNLYSPEPADAEERRRLRYRAVPDAPGRGRIRRRGAAGEHILAHREEEDRQQGARRPHGPHLEREEDPAVLAEVVHGRFKEGRLLDAAQGAREEAARARRTRRWSRRPESRWPSSSTRWRSRGRPGYLT